MKKILGMIILILAINGIVEADSAMFQGVVADPLAVSISTSAWTALPSTTTVNISRTGIYLLNPTSNTAAFNVYISSMSATPTVSTNTAIIELTKGEEQFLDISGFLYVFAVSKHTSAESITYQQTLDTRN
ncbi:MAG: hypothetical protein KAJ48_07995 [Elusimicrobiales bacterium]|nr:hypothetical protein [Elusimicrobiales bacterium]